MGVDLTLVPVEYLSTNGDGKLWGYGHSQLSLGRQRMLWDAIDALKPEKLPEGSDISAYVSRRSDGEEGYGRLVTTPYGDPYTWIEASKLVEVMRNFPPQAPAMEYLAKLPPDTKIILHWH